MKNIKQKLLIEQTDRKIKVFKEVGNVPVPSSGWIHTIRTALKMSLRQMGERLGISPQSVQAMEIRESSRSITLKSLDEAAKVLDMKLVYGFVSKHDSLESMIEKRAYELAQEIVMRTHNTMKLEDQQNSKQRISKAIESRVEEIKNTMPKYLWD